VLSSVLAFSVLAALLTIAPGPDFVLVVRTAIGYGRRRAIAASLGICTGLFVWALVSAAGITALLTASKIAFTVLRLAGAGYLLWLGFDAIRHAGRDDDQAAPRFRTPWHAFRTGVLNNILNPKVGVFYVTVLPTFIPNGTPVLATSMLLACIHVVQGIVWLVAVALLVERARAVLTQRRIRRRLEQATGAALVGFGVTVALDAAR
jgi:RhtB (resistance to homoserine/threonine) family protein